MPQNKCSAECKKKKKVMRGRRADQTEAASGGKGHNIRATVRAVQSTRLVWNDKPRYYNGGSKRKNCLEVKVVEEMKSAGGDIVRVVDPKDVKVGLVVVPDANTPIDPVKAEMIEVFKKGGKRKGQEEPNPVRPVHGHPGRFHLEGGTSQSHEKKCFFAVKVSVSVEAPDTSTIRTISTIAKFSLSDGRTEDRIWLMSKLPKKKKKADTTKSVAPPSSSNKRKRDEIENTPQQAKKERVKTKPEMAAVKTEYETAAVKKDQKYGIEVVTMPLSSFVDLKNQLHAVNQEYERMKSELEKLRRVVSHDRRACCTCCRCAGCTGFTFPFDVIAPRSKSTEITQADFSAMHNRTTDVDEDADVDVERVSLQYTRSTESISRLQLDLCRSTSSLRRSDSVKTYDDGTIKTPLLDP